MGNSVKICCGPRCGAEPDHRWIYAAVEQVAAEAEIDALPTMCRSSCGNGVTVVLPNGAIEKVLDVATAKLLPVSKSINHAKH